MNLPESSETGIFSDRPGSPVTTGGLQLGRRIDWRAHLREFAVVLLGVLAALAAQAWWESRDDRGRERDYLEQLLSDTRENERRLDQAIGQDSLTRSDLQRVTTRLFGVSAVLPPDSLVHLFTGNSLGSSDFKPLSGTYDALLAAGDLRLIRTDSLRARIIQYAATLNHERDMLKFFLQQAFGDGDRIVMALPFMRRFFSGPEAMRDDLKASGISTAQIRNSKAVAAIMFTLQAANSNRLDHLNRLRNDTRDLRRVMEAESR